MTTAYGWNEEVNDCDGGGDFVLLRPDKYPFKIVGLEKSYQNATQKIVGGCHKAIVSIEVDGGDQGIVTWKENLLLHEVCRGILGGFFLSIGLREHGQGINTGWFSAQTLIGKTGLCKTSTRKWTNKSGEERESNQVKTWMEMPKQPTPAPVAPPPAPVAPPMPVAPPLDEEEIPF